MGTLKLLFLGAAALAVTGAVVHSGGGCPFSCGNNATAPAIAKPVAAPAAPAAAETPQTGSGLMAYVDANGNLAAAPPASAKSAAKSTAGVRHFEFSHYIDPNDPSKGFAVNAVNMQTSSIATIGADGKMTTRCVDANGREVIEPTSSKQEATH